MQVAQGGGVMRAGSVGSGFVCWIFLFYFHEDTSDVGN